MKMRMSGAVSLHFLESKVNFTLEQETKALMWSEEVALLFL